MTKFGNYSMWLALVTQVPIVDGTSLASALNGLNDDGSGNPIWRSEDVKAMADLLPQAGTSEDTNLRDALQTVQQRWAYVLTNAKSDNGSSPVYPPTGCPTATDLKSIKNLS